MIQSYRCWFSANMKLFEEALFLSQLEHQLASLANRRKTLQAHVLDTQALVIETMEKQLHDTHQVTY